MRPCRASCQLQKPLVAAGAAGEGEGEGAQAEQQQTLASVTGAAALQTAGIERRTFASRQRRDC